MIDRIIGKHGDVYAVMDYSPDASIAHYFRGHIIEYMFPAGLRNLLDERITIVNEMAIALLDDVETEIYNNYECKLKGKNIKIFCIEIRNENEILFFDKYPTGRGFVDDYPGLNTE